MRVNLALLIFIFVSSADAKFYKNDSKYCYSSDCTHLQLKMFSTNTPYDSVRGSAFNPSSCTPKRFWFLSRHGSRYPSVADRDPLFTTTDPTPSNINANYELGKTTLCEFDAKNIKEWHLDPIMLRTDASADLAATGREELKSVARRYQRKFPGLLPKTYSHSNYFFRNSPVPRTRQTAEAFAEGLFGARGYQIVNYTMGSSPDLMMYSFAYCPAWKKIVMRGSSSQASEFQAFADGPKFQEMLTQVSNKLGFIGSKRLTDSQIITLMTHCQYEAIVNRNRSSPFCSVFSYANVQVFEYYKDLQFYYVCGYGLPEFRALFKNMNCYLVKDMLNYLQATDNQKARLSFGHDFTMQFFMVAMGLFEDTVPLTAQNFEQQSLRKWRTSFISPMGANLAVVRYE